jgi:UDP-N-acetylglucosamine--N-acetylmuramyl-(pentapeptide) pyrophosphoryl-undecaprenol N-acetylglucosamine transferase
LNDWVFKNFEALAKAGISVYCVTGLGKSSSSSMHQVNQQGVDVGATLVPFSDQMGDVISAADLVISRAGAGSIAELIRCRAPSILIPYPFAADDHQRANAQMHEQRGACIVVPQDKLETLLTEVKALAFNDWLLAKFKSNLEDLDRFESSERIATDLVEMCEDYARKRLESMEASV